MHNVRVDEEDDKRFTRYLLIGLGVVVLLLVIGVLVATLTGDPGTAPSFRPGQGVGP